MVMANFLRSARLCVRRAAPVGLRSARAERWAVARMCSSAAAASSPAGVALPEEIPQVQALLQDLDAEDEAWSVQMTRRDISVPPRKLERLARQINGLTVNEAFKQLLFSHKQSMKVQVSKVLRKCVLVAEDRHGAKIGDLVVAEAMVNHGMKLKRLRYHARGALRAHCVCVPPPLDRSRAHALFVRSRTLPLPPSVRTSLASSRPFRPGGARDSAQVALDAEDSAGRAAPADPGDVEVAPRAQGADGAAASREEQSPGAPLPRGGIVQRTVLSFDT